jgi:hypothetical protein
MPTAGPVLQSLPLAGSSIHAGLPDKLLAASQWQQWI